MSKKVRVRFAPSPTGGLHLGGVRTVLYNYLFAKKMGGQFIVRVEDTDQSRFVPGAEEYIFDCLRWCGLEPDESVQHGGPHGPYRQSERKSLYKKYAEQLVAAGHAYYAFDTTAELEQMREKYKSTENPSPQYDHHLRLKMRNSLTLPVEEVNKLLAANTPHVVRIKMPVGKTIGFQDLIRGEVCFDTSLVDDKVLLKADGMPTYHLAVVVDDYLMKITHAFRGEEWLPSAPVHLLLWQYLFGLEEMPQWAHFPLILGPNGKLSKRDGAKYGFPVFAMNWQDPKTQETTAGFREKGFLPSAFINLLALLGWNDGSEKEIFSKEELIASFDLSRVHSSGAKFDYEKAKWFNHEWIKQTSASELLPLVSSTFENANLQITNLVLLEQVIALVKDRCTLLTDFIEQSSFFFNRPAQIDTASILPKWSAEKSTFFDQLIHNYQQTNSWTAAELEKICKELAQTHQLKTGELLLPLRIMLVGEKFGPGVFDIACLLGKEETLERLNQAKRLILQGE
ncbi:MAG: glutamate--tRNA ligase [Bacteroidetes bacterium]|nr:glutamate--tRNA ligase [Bacteroidota bacterium]